MRRLIWIGVGVAIAVVVVHQVSRTSFGAQFRRSMAEHEATLRAALLPDEAELARARETRARHAHRAVTDLDDADVLPDDGTDYF